MHKCFIVCWFGKLPDYFPVWVKTCEYNISFDFLLVTDTYVKYTLPKNIKNIIISKDDFLKKVHTKISNKATFDKPYRLCDFRPMYGIIFEEELKGYSFWGYCDIDIVFGCIEKILPDSLINQYDAVFNGGHFTLLRNTYAINNMFKKPGALFDYQTVIQKEAIFAFDETTGIQRIFKYNNVNALYGIPYLETESKYKQLRSRMDRTNPDNQAFYWEKGHLYRTKLEVSEVYYQELVYIHLQKRKIKILDDNVISGDSFWITPSGYWSKTYEGKPNIKDILTMNPDDGEYTRKKQKFVYSIKKLWEIANRSFYQKYVRVKQQMSGINREDSSREELKWTKF